MIHIIMQLLFVKNILFYVHFTVFIFYLMFYNGTLLNVYETLYVYKHYWLNKTYESIDISNSNK